MLKIICFNELIVVMPPLLLLVAQLLNLRIEMERHATRRFAVSWPRALIFGARVTAIIPGGGFQVAAPGREGIFT